jgi:hypothetical protein
MMDAINPRRLHTRLSVAHRRNASTHSNNTAHRKPPTTEDSDDERRHKPRFQVLGLMTEHGTSLSPNKKDKLAAFMFRPPKQGETRAKGSPARVGRAVLGMFRILKL